MTEITIDRDIRKTKYIVNSLVFILMIIGIYFVFKIFTWAVDHRINNVETMTETKITAEVREKQLGCLARNIYHEAGSEPDRKSVV